MSQAILGGTLKIEALAGDVMLEVSLIKNVQHLTIESNEKYIFVQIKPGTSSHTRIRLPGKGLKKANSYGHGDHYVVVRVKAPTRLSREQKAAIKVISSLQSFHYLLLFHFSLHVKANIDLVWLISGIRGA